MALKGQKMYGWTDGEGRPDLETLLVERTDQRPVNR